MFQKQKLRVKIKEYDILFPEIVIAQAKLECGHFKSNVFYQHNNLFGFEKKTIMYFDNWIECVAFYSDWQDRYYKKFINKNHPEVTDWATNENLYYEFLSKYFNKYIGYCEKLKAM